MKGILTILEWYDTYYHLSSTLVFTRPSRSFCPYWNRIPCLRHVPQALFPHPLPTAKKNIGHATRRRYKSWVSAKHTARLRAAENLVDHERGPIDTPFVPLRCPASPASCPMDHNASDPMSASSYQSISLSPGLVRYGPHDDYLLHGGSGCPHVRRPHQQRNISWDRNCTSAI